VTLVYLWIIFGMFWVGMPYTLRDQISWIHCLRKALASRGFRRTRLWSATLCRWTVRPSICSLRRYRSV
jgi:hypothetical protein